jgi:ubiquinone/menaquinone biosynthesis C-methylase UbiE
MFSEPEKVVPYLGLTAGMTVADFGCGSGAYALAMAKAVGDQGGVYAVDVQKNLLDKLAKETKSRAGASALHVVWGNIEKAGGAKLADRSVELVLLANTLFQSHARYSIFLEAKRVLRPGGRLAVVEWRASYGGLGPSPEAVVKPEEAKAAAAEAGLTASGEFPAGEHHYGLMFTKGTVSVASAS